MNSTDELTLALDDLSIRGDYGVAEARAVMPQLPASAFAVPRIDTLVAGFSNVCHLKCPFCYEEHYGRVQTEHQDLDIGKLIRLIRQHRDESGASIEYFRIGNTGEPLIHKDLGRLITETQDCVNWFSVISSLSVKNSRILGFLADHSKVNMIHVSCDASDPETYAKLRTNGDFETVWSNIATMKKAGKHLVLNAIAFRENMDSILGLPTIMEAYGVDELHIFYPLNTTDFLSRQKLGKPSLEDFQSLLLQIREQCEKRSIVFRTDPWAFHPAMAGVIADIDTPEQYDAYVRMPCDWLWLLILHPDGSFHNCSVLNTTGSDLPVDRRPFARCSSLLDLANSEEVLSFRKLHFTGHFPAPCRKICHKRSSPRSEAEVQLMFRLRYGSPYPQLRAEEFTGHLLGLQSKFAVRAFSENVKKFLAAFPVLAQRVEFVVDRNRKIDCPFPVFSRDDFYRSQEKHILLMGSSRSSVFQQVAERASRFAEIYRLVVIGSDPGDFRVQRVL